MHTPIWICRKEQATPSPPDVPSGSQQQGSSQSSDDDSDSDDSRPLCDLGADSFPLGQLAKRTAFQAHAAKPFPTDDDDDDDKDLHEARYDLLLASLCTGI